ncbi:hypothetical protein, partial [Kordiimonas sediminis]|uniref:hypothetical protein n=1 Tax=Kordiimonas sediminis TaxID=1735581 RepID=UPI00174B3D31
IRENKPERISVRDLQRTSGLSALGNAESITDTCLELMGHAWLQPAFTRRGESHGRAAKAFTVNPAVFI